MAPLPKNDNPLASGVSDREKRARAHAARRALGESTSTNLADFLGPTQSELYKLIAVPEQCSQQELQAAYKRRALEEHPDKGGDQASFIRVAQAYETLRKNESGGADSEGFGFHEGMSEDEMMHRASDMFEQVIKGLDILSDGDKASEMLDALLFKDEDGNDMHLGLTGRWFRWGFKKVVASFAPWLLTLLTSDNAQINIGGETMSGAELKHMHEKSKNKRKAAPEVDL
mmetsp:Transcript_101741/g.258657  ORF Transcript_101741/g.258657 Transcript_101741/m.258657 type:complete len:229 (-) Transcript_101741:91-777(-)